MKLVKLYVGSYCPYCRMAEALLNSKGVEFEAINVDDDPELLNRIKNETGMRTIPQIFIGDEFIGGFTELSGLDSDGELDKKLQS